MNISDVLRKIEETKSKDETYSQGQLPQSGDVEELTRYRIGGEPKLRTVKSQNNSY